MATRKTTAKPKAPAKTWKVTVTNSGESFDCRPSETVLQAAVAAGVDYPFACATGNCASCISELKSGKVTLLPYNDSALPEAQKDAGRTLACRAKPRSDLEITWLTKTAFRPGG